MRHQNKVSKLRRPKQARDLMIINQVKSLLKEGQIKTTEAKAKVTKSFTDSLLAKLVDMDEKQAFRFAESKLKNKKFAEYLVGDIKPKLEKATSYTKKYKLENRKGDNAKMTMLELINYKKSKK